MRLDVNESFKKKKKTISFSDILLTDGTEFQFNLKLGNDSIKFKTIAKEIKKIIDKGDPAFEFVIEYGTSSKTLGFTSWKPEGTLIRLKDMKFSAVMQSIETGKPIFGNIAVHSPNVLVE